MSVLGRPIGIALEDISGSGVEAVNPHTQGTAYEEVINAYDAYVPFLSVSGYEDVESYSLVTDFNKMLRKVTRVALERGNGVATGTPLEGQIDILQAMKVKGKPFYDYLSEEFPGLSREVALATFLLRVSACYVEVPTTRMVQNSVINGYVKFLATSNYSITTEWLKGAEMRPATLKKFKAGMYSSGRGTATVDGYPVVCDDEVPYVKLDVDRKTNERKIVNPRSGFDIKEGTRITPLYVLEVIADYIRETSSQGYTSVRFLKDGGDEREVVTTYNDEKLKGIYTQYISEEELEELLSGRYEGNYFESDTLTRGYVRFTSVGESYHESSLNRSISLSRVMGTATGEGVVPNVEHIRVNTKLISPTFCTTITKLAEMGHSDKLAEITKNLHDFQLTPYLLHGRDEDILRWLERAEKIGGTNFLRELATFMVALPGLFPEYAKVYKQDRSDEPTNRGTADSDDLTGTLF